MRVEDIIKEWRLILFVTIIAFSFFWIKPFSGTDGVVVDLASSPASSSLTTGQIITSVNGIAVNNFQDYYSALETISPGDVVRVIYKVETFPYSYSERTAYPFVAGTGTTTKPTLASQFLTSLIQTSSLALKSRAEPR